MMIRRLIWIVPVAAMLLGGCEDLFSRSAPSRDYGELVDRMVKAMQGRSPTDAAANLFNVTSPDERRDAIAWLETKKWGHEAPYMKAYQVLTTDPHPMVRAQAMMALGHSYKPAEAVSYLIKGLSETEDVQVRRDASYGLMFTWSDEAFPPLIERLQKDGDDQVRGNCARALAHAHSPEAVHALIEALQDRDAA